MLLVSGDMVLSEFSWVCHILIAALLA